MRTGDKYILAEKMWSVWESSFCFLVQVYCCCCSREATTIPSEPIIRVGEHCQKSPVKYELIIIKCVRGGYDISTFFMRKIWKSSFKIFKNINIFLLNLEECIYNVELVPWIVMVLYIYIFLYSLGFSLNNILLWPPNVYSKDVCPCTVPKNNLIYCKC